MTLDRKWIKRIIIIIVFLFILYMSITDLTFRPDEEFTMALIKHNFLNVIRLDSYDVHPPLYYLLLKLFLDITTFWTSSIFIKIILARLFSSVIVIITFIIMYKLISNLGIHKDIYVTLLVFMLFPGIIFFTTQIRMYALAGLFLSLEFYELDKFDRLGNKCYLLLLILFSILTAYTHYFAAVSAGILLLVFFIKYLFNKDNNRCFYIFISGISLIISYIPWMFYSLIKLRGNSNVNNYNIPVTAKTVLNQVLGIPIKFTGISDSSLGSLKAIFIYPIILIMIVLMTVLVIFSLRHLNKYFNERLEEELITFILTAVVCSIMKMLGFEYSAMFLYPIFVINVMFIVNIIWESFNKNKVIHILIIICGLFFIFCAISSVYYGYKNYNQSLNEVQNINLLDRKQIVKISNGRKIKKNSIPIRSQQLLENKKIFHTIDLSTYLLYYNKRVVINNKNDGQVFLMTNSKKIGNKIWSNVKLNHSFK